MKAVLLDAASLGDDIDLSPLRALVDDLEVHALTAPEQRHERLAGAQVALVNKVVLDAELIDALPDLALICVLATGTNNIDMQAAERRGIAVRNVTAYGTDSVAQHTLMLMLALAARLPHYQSALRDGAWQRSEIFCLLDQPTLQLADKHLVIVRPTLADLLGELDVLSLHCPLTEATRGLIDAQALATMKPEALLINCARGGIIDEHAALEALRQGRLGGLAVDSLPSEPPREGHALLDALHEPLNLIVTPHNAWISPEARQRVVTLTADNLRAWRH